MKKLMALILAMIMLVSFAGCGKAMCSVEGCENEAVEDTTYDESLCDKHFKGSYQIKGNSFSSCGRR